MGRLTWPSGKEGEFGAQDRNRAETKCWPPAWERTTACPKPPEGYGFHAGSTLCQVLQGRTAAYSSATSAPTQCCHTHTYPFEVAPWTSDPTNSLPPTSKRGDLTCLEFSSL